MGPIGYVPAICFVIWQNIFANPTPQWPKAEQELRLWLCHNDYSYSLRLEQRLVDGETREIERAGWSTTYSYYWLRKSDPKDPNTKEDSTCPAPCENAPAPPSDSSQ
jgi:hypothetical protein